MSRAQDAVVIDESPSGLAVREAIATLTLPETNASVPVAVDSVAVGPSGYNETRVGFPVTTVVRLTVRDSWHTSENVPNGNPMVTTAIEVVLPKGARWIEE